MIVSSTKTKDTGTLLLLLPMLALCSAGCISNDFFRQRPMLSQQYYTHQTGIWESTIKDNYPSWKEPSVTVTSFGGRKNKRVSKFSHKGPKRYLPKSRSRHHQKFLGSPYPNRFKGARQSNKVYTTYFKYEPKGELPKAIIDRGDQIPPAATQAYKIVPVETIVPLSAPQPSRAGARNYRVLKGETLVQISRKFYGDDSGWKRIFNVNRDMISSPHHIKPGMILIIP